MSTVTFLRLLPRAPTTRRNRFGSWRWRRDGSAICPAPAQVLAGERGRVALDLGGRALRDDLAAVLAGPGPHVDHVVGRVDRLLVVLDHDHRVAQVAQALERVDEPRVVALVQADRGLVEHVHHAGEPRADLAGEADALRLAAGEGVCRAGEGEVVETHVVQEADPVGDLAQDLVRDRLPVARELQLFEERLRVLEGHRQDVLDRAPGHPDVARFQAQPRAAAVRARAVVEVLGELLLDRGGVGLAEAALQVGQDSLEGVLSHGRLAALAGVAEGDLLVARTVQHHGLRALGQASRTAVSTSNP